MARIRAAEWESEAYWIRRIDGYLSGALHPQQALAPRTAFVAVEDGEVIGFVAGHLTRRFGCDGELEWINVVASRRRSGVASGLLRLLAQWFVEQNARRICIDAGSDAGRAFYRRHGARDLNPHWMAWDDIGEQLESKK